MSTQPKREMDLQPGSARAAEPSDELSDEPSAAPSASAVAAPSASAVAAPSASAVAAPSASAVAGLERLLLATDLSEASFAATEEAFLLAGRLGASLLVVSVIDPGSLLLPGGRFRVRIDQVREHREVAAQALVERGREEGVPVSFLVWTGDPGDMIVSAAEAERTDMIVVGSHGRGAVGRLFLGSVSEHVVRNAPCPVLVVRPRDVTPK